MGFPRRALRARASTDGAPQQLQRFRTNGARCDKLMTAVDGKSVVDEVQQGESVDHVARHRVIVGRRAAPGRPSIHTGRRRVTLSPPGFCPAIQLAVQVALAGGVPVPWKPNSVLPPAGTWPLYDMLAKVTVPALPLGCAFHELVSVEPPGIGTDTDQWLIAEEPAVTRTVVTKPPVQALS